MPQSLLEALTRLAAMRGLTPPALILNAQPPKPAAPRPYWVRD